MISLKEYLKVDGEKNRFDLPLSFFGSLNYTFTTKFLESLPFFGLLYIEESKIKKYYWQIIVNFIKKEFDFDFAVYQDFFNGNFLQNVGLFYYNGPIHNLKNLKGYGNDISDEEIAISKSVGEFLERYLTCVLNEKEKQKLKKMKLVDIKKQVKTVRDYYGFNAEQLLNNSNLDILDQDEFEVLQIEDILNNKKVYYPYRQVFWNQHLIDEKKIADLTTSGCAGGFTLAEACLGALYETVERDSFFCYWLTKTSPEMLIFNEGEMVEYDNYKKFLEDCGYDIFILDITTETDVSSFLCGVVDRVTKGVCISGGSDLDFKKAILKAINESRSCIGFFSSGNTFVLPTGYKPFETKGILRNERINLGKDGKHFENYVFLFSGERKNFSDFKKTEYKFEDKREEFDFLLKRLKEKGFQEIYRYVSKDERLEKLGYFVVRIIVPKLYQLYLREDHALTSSLRLDEFNLWKNKKSEFEINIWPHLFP